jgi:O-acetyl-ADP-ribose deacetylase (regulator of RNase III)
MMNVIDGDATKPKDWVRSTGTNHKYIIHVCNDEGKWGAGFVLALSNKWSYPEDFYRARQKYPLGHADILSVDRDDKGKAIFVANMIGQHLIRPAADGTPPIRYEAVRQALEKVNHVAEKIGATLHMPRIGCGLAGGSWKDIEAILEEVVTVDVTVYDLP